jgi:hypothetical protein
MAISAAVRAEQPRTERAVLVKALVGDSGDFKRPSRNIHSALGTTFRRGFETRRRGRASQLSGVNGGRRPFIGHDETFAHTVAIAPPARNWRNLPSGLRW